jgi:CheY-like chemotaxis protein
MPILDGYETVKILRDKSAAGKLDISKTKIIALSAITRSSFDQEI